MKSAIETLTSQEAIGLECEYNLADAHTHQNPSTTQRAIIARMPQMFFDSAQRSQQELSRESFSAFMRLNGQSIGRSDRPALCCYSASMATELVANYLRRERIGPVGLIEPTFDMIPDVLRRHDLDVRPIRESTPDPGELLRAASSGSEGALFIVMPNNPTGTYLSREEFAQLAMDCEAANKLLILDLCFRLFESGCGYDQYAILRDSGVRYIAIEDTGKVFPTNDLKCSYVTCAPSEYEALSRIHDDFLLNIPPLILALVVTFSADAEANRSSAVHDVIDRNRNALRQCLAEFPARVVNRRSRVSVEWLQLEEISSQAFARVCRERGLAVLPGPRFFWSDAAGRDEFLRVALAREPERFDRALGVLRERLDWACANRGRCRSDQ